MISYIKISLDLLRNFVEKWHIKIFYFTYAPQMTLICICRLLFSHILLSQQKSVERSHVSLPFLSQICYSCLKVLVQVHSRIKSSLNLLESSRLLRQNRFTLSVPVEYSRVHSVPRNFRTEFSHPIIFPIPVARPEFSPQPISLNPPISSIAIQK